MCGWRELYFTEERYGDGFPFGDFGSRQRGRLAGDFPSRNLPRA